ncbi:glycosyltransferase family protein [Parafilimonas sp.]|uniref:glycosyltransferase family protein n=1 Tax=Parafilimonas sp. TaxID=1969739 RepID=UPI003F7D0B00
MKIFYAVQATGNGHIARAIELLPYLQQYGTVDIFLSGNNSSLQTGLPVRYKSKGVSLYYTQGGGLDYIRMMKEFSARRVWKEAKDLPVENYDCVLVDFESIAALSCRLKKVSCIGFGHQASFQSAKVPRPAIKNIAGEWILKYYAPSTVYTGLHFKQYDHFIFNPVIKDVILKAEPDNKNHITVYLPQYNDDLLVSYFRQLKDVPFHLFSKTAKSLSIQENIIIQPVNNNAFNKSIINCFGVITGAGFETPAEILYLGKKLLCIPIKGQYEQKCNAAALKDFNVPVIESIDENFVETIINWLQQHKPKQLQLTHSTEDIVAFVMQQAKRLIH